MNNSRIAEIFRDVASILEIKNENVFRIRAYERAAQNIESLSEDAEIAMKENRLLEIPGIGKDLAAKMQEIITTGKLSYLEELKKAVPEGLLELLKIPSVGPKTAKLLHDELHIKNIAGLQQAISKSKLQGIAGIKEKTIENIKKGIELVKKGKERMTLAEAIQVSNSFINALRIMPAVKRISAAGSLRRRKETVRDIDILMTSRAPGKVMDTFVKLPEVKDILARGETKASVRTKDDVQIDCRVVEEKSFGAALLYFTGSKNFNIKLRQLAIKKGLKINEYGVFKKGRFVCGKTEDEIFKLLAMSYIEPELREDTGEIERAKQHTLPRLIEAKDMRGDLHVHSHWSDGSNSILEMALAAKKRGYSYIAITDHSQGLKVAGGLSRDDLAKKKKEIEKINTTLQGFTVLYATEVDIDATGKLDYHDDILQGFDIVVAALHSGFKQSKAQLTNRIVSACKNKYVHIIAHPTARLWGERQPYDLDFEEIFKVARDTHTALEINSYPQRLDLNDLHARAAKERGVKIAINTDAHTIDQLEYMALGVSVGRRGWLTPEDVINTLSLKELLKRIKK